MCWTDFWWSLNRLPGEIGGGAAGDGVKDEGQIGNSVEVAVDLDAGHGAEFNLIAHLIAKVGGEGSGSDKAESRIADEGGNRGDGNQVGMPPGSWLMTMSKGSSVDQTL